MKVALLLLLVLPTVAHAGFFDGVSGMAGDVGNFFGSNWEGVKSVFAGNQKDMEGNVGKVGEMLRGVKAKMGALELIANDNQKQTLRKVDGFLQQVLSFQNQIKSDGESKFGQNKSKWEQMARSIFETGGMNEILKLISTQSGTTSSCLAAAAVLPMIYLFR